MEQKRINPKIWVRAHRGAYTESMETAVQIPATMEAVLAYFKEQHPFVNYDQGIEVERYGDGEDPRNDWDTHIVTRGAQGIGFTSGPVSPAFDFAAIDDPREIGSAEYRAIHELVSDAEGWDEAIGIADEFLTWAQSVKTKLENARNGT